MHSPYGSLSGPQLISGVLLLIPMGGSLLWFGIGLFFYLSEVFCTSSNPISMFLLRLEGREGLFRYDTQSRDAGVLFAELSIAYLL